MQHNIGNSSRNVKPSDPEVSSLELTTLYLDSLLLLPEPFRLSIARYHMSFAMIGGPYEQTAFYIVKTEVITGLAQFGEFIRVNKTDDGQMFFCRLKILAQGDDIHSAAAKVFHRLHHFFHSF